MIEFRLSAKQNNTYLDLFPRTSVNAIVNIVNDEHIRGTQVLEVDVPVTTETIQAIAIQTNNRIVDAPFEVHYVSGDKNSYNTISQIEVSENTLTIYRIHNKPEASVKIALVFYTMGVDGYGK